MSSGSVTPATGSLPDGWTANDPSPGDLTGNGSLILGATTIGTSSVETNAVVTNGGGIQTNSDSIDLGGGVVDHAFAVTTDEINLADAAFARAAHVADGSTVDDLRDALVTAGLMAAS